MISLLLAVIYLCFISLGLPDSLLGSAWPTIYQEMNVPVSYMAYVSMTISFGTIISSLLSDKLSRKLGSGLLTALSILLTCIGLLSFSLVNKYWMFFLCAIPYGLGAGGVDAVLNNYVALHFKSKHMSWLHCMWGIGASISPNIMAIALSKGSWHLGYLTVFIIQAILCFIVFISLPLWKRNEKLKNNDLSNNLSNLSNLSNKEDPTTDKPLGVIGVLKLKGAILVFLAFFCYCAFEQIVFQWSATYFVNKSGISENLAASFASFVLIGLTIGRFINGFLSMKFKDHTLIFIGSFIILIGVILLIIPGGVALSIAAMIIIGLGAGPIYPSIVHSTPILFGKTNSQAMIGVQMAFAYIANMTMPAVFGNIAERVGFVVMPYFVLIFLVGLVVFYKVVLNIRKKENLNNIDN